MATAIRPPFYVPNPPSLQEWFSSPTRSYLLQALTNQKIFGVSGQVPTKLWRWDYDDASTWQWKPPTCAFLAQLTKQPPTKSWKGVYDFDSSSFWQGSPEEANLTNLVNSVGIVRKPKQWRWDYDDQGVWSLNVDLNRVLFNSLQPQAPLNKATWTSPPPVDTPVWQQQLSQNLSLQALQVQPPTPRWRMDVDTGDVWQAKFSLNNVLLSQPVVNPFVNRRDLGLDTSDVWQRSFSTNIAFFQKPFVNRRELGVSPDDVWQSKTAYNNLLLPQEVFGSPFINNKWQYGDAESAPWQYQIQPYIGTIQVTPPPPVTDLHNLPFLVTVGRLKSF